MTYRLTFRVPKPYRRWRSFVQREADPGPVSGKFRARPYLFEKRHGMTFERFRRRVEKRRGREWFADEEDLMAWQFAREGVEY